MIHKGTIEGGREGTALVLKSSVRALMLLVGSVVERDLVSLSRADFELLYECVTDALEILNDAKPFPPPQAKTRTREPASTRSELVVGSFEGETTCPLVATEETQVSLCD